MPKARIIILLLFYYNVVAAQPATNAVLYSITEKDGLTDNVANCFFQDSRGVMWIGTNYGLNSFDGSVIKNFHAGTSSTTLAHDAVNDIKEDNNKNLWIATGNGLSFYNIEKKTFSTFRYDTLTPALNRYYSLAITGQDILLATEEGLMEFTISTKKFTLHKAGKEYANRITKVFADSKKNTWLGTYDGLWLYNNNNHQFTCYDTPANDALFDGLITDIIEDHTGQIWFGCWTKGLKKLNTATKNIETFLSWKNSNGNVTCLAEQKNKDGTFSLWQTANLCKPDARTQSFTYLYNDNKPISGNRIYCDANNLLWISTNEGIKIYNPAKQYFQTTVLSSYVPLTSQGIALYPLPGKFLLGGEGGTSLLLFSDSVKLIKNLSAKVSNGAALMSIQKSTAGNYWMCSSNGVFVFDSILNRKHFFLHNDNDKTSLPKNFVNNTLIKTDGTVWLLPWRKGVWRADETNKSFYRVTTVKGDTLLPNSNLSKAIEDKNGNIWISDFSGGLFKYEPKTGTIKNIIEQRRFSNEYVLADKLWTVSSYEIFAVDINTDKITTWHLPQGKNKYEYDFTPDNKGWLWIATKTGLLAFNMQTGQFKSFTTDDGLFANDLDVTLTTISNGNILMASGNYAASFSPSIVQQPVNGAPLLFTCAAVDGIEKDSESDALHFLWNENNIQLNWALLNYSNPLGNIYYYKLDGINNTWQTAGNKGNISFNSLAPGTYLFHYKAATSEGMMSEEKTIRIVVHPPFWKTWWFILLGIVLIATLFYAVVKYISQRNLKEKLLQLEKEQAVEKERNRISRDMHDELGSGLTKIAILTEVIKTQQQSNEHIEKISTTARGLVDNLDEMVWALNPKNDSLDKLAAYIAEYAHQFLDGTGIDCHIELPDEIIPTPVSEEKRRNIFMVVKEFLNNTVKHSGAKNVFIALQQMPQYFALTLRDDGKGFNVQQQKTPGNGLKNMQQRIEDTGGKATLHSSGDGTKLIIEFT